MLAKHTLCLSAYSITVGVCNNEADGIGLGCALHEVGLQPKSRFSAAGTADDKHVFVPRRLGVFRTVVHGKPLCLGQDDVVFKSRIDVGLDVRGCSP